MLAVVMLINRAGSMVLPFLSIYLTQALGFSIEQTGVVLACYGLGAMAGSMLGGWLSDKIGNYSVQVLSLTIGGALLIMLSFVQDYHTLLPAVFLVSMVLETLRPANAASVATYSKPENITRSYSLNRMAVNLGFSVGPAIGGLLAAQSYQLLFYVDGLTCMAAGLFFFIYFRRKGGHVTTQKTSATPAKVSPYTNLSFITFILLSGGFALVFFQLFNTLPLFYREVHMLSESTIGILLGLNGLIVFTFEMVFVHHFEKRISIVTMVVLGTMLCGMSFAALTLSSGIYILFIAMIILSLAEIMAMPFMITHVIGMAGGNKQGSYIGLYSLAWSCAFMMSPYLSTRILAQNGFDVLWWSCAAFSVITGIGFYINMKIAKRSV